VGAGYRSYEAFWIGGAGAIVAPISKQGGGMRLGPARHSKASTIPVRKRRPDERTEQQKHLDRLQKEDNDLIAIINAIC
jgi:hypothetical protein